MLRSLTVLLALGLAACSDTKSGKGVAQALGRAPTPDELPRMTNAVAPFRYPTSLYAQKVQGNVTLRLFIDEKGQVRPESTQVAESSHVPALDSAAVLGATQLTFVPAKLRGEPMGVSVLFPVLFRHPDATPLPGDSARKP